VIGTWEVPFVNTLLLLTSGASVTWCHHGLVSGRFVQSIFSLTLTLLLALVFTGLQLLEYVESVFSISTCIYGSVFFMATGFHGFHVLAGTVFLGFCLTRLLQNYYTKNHHFSFEAAAWYWHFVDCVWLILFIFIYWWGGL